MSSDQSISDTPEPENKAGANALNLDFTEICAEAKASGGFFLETERHVVVHVPGRDRLVVGFDNLSSLNTEGPRKPWAYELARAEGWGVLGVMIKARDWFRSGQLYDALESLRDDGLFRSYPAVSMYGASMGGYGACNFAPLAPGCCVVAFAPQSSLSALDATFEKRYPYARNVFDWANPRWRDAAEGVRAAGRAYLVYDPLVAEDKLHAARLNGENVIDLPWPHITHKVPPTFKRMGILKPIALGMLSGTLTKNDFHRLLRVRRETPVYLHRMLSHASQKGHHQLVENVLSSLPSGYGGWKLRSLRRENLAQMS